MKTNVVSVSVASVETELLVVMAWDSSPAAGNGDTQPAIQVAAEDAVRTAAQAVLGGGEFKADSGETLLLHNPSGLKAKRLLLVGLGKAAKVTAHEVRKAAGVAVRFAKPRNVRDLAIAVPVAEALAPQLTVRALVEGAIVADFDPDVYRSDRKDRSLVSLQVVLGPGGDQGAAEAGMTEGVVVAESQNFARTLINEPGNRMTPTILGERAAEMCRESGLQCEVYSTEKLRELQMGAFLSVTQGSDEPPALIVMRYEPKDAPADGPVLGLVGKGITFDSGGISLKPADSMEKMKYDMAGGAAMIGAMRAIARLQPRVRVLGIVCAAENMPSGKAQKPGDVQISMPFNGRPGKSIEIINTDAEGRLVLADGLTYARKLGATHLINAATLTGAVAVALATINGGAFSNDDESFGRFAEGLKISGERFWRLPVEDEYRELIKSTIADIKNTGGRYGGAITAAMFLKEFVGETPWIHLDIAGIAWSDDAKPWAAAGPTGAAVRSIIEWVRSFSA